jgi:hypothetical protein
MRKGIYHDKTT